MFYLIYNINGYKNEIALHIHTHTRKQKYRKAMKKRSNDNLTQNEMK